MNVLEFAAQGVRGFSSSVRVPLKAGVNRVLPPGEEPVPIGAVLAALLYADGRGQDASLAAAGQKAKAALSFLGRDGVTYRIVRELGGSGRLQKQVGGQSEVVSQDPAEIAQYLRAQAGLPTQKGFEALCLFTRAQYPSRRPRLKAGSELASANEVQPAADVDAARAKLGELEKELQLSNDLEKIQFEQDGLASQLFELEQRLQKVSVMRSQIAEAERAVAQAPTIAFLKLPEDILARVERYPQATAKREEALARLEQERTEASEEIAAHVEPLSRDPRFWGAIAVGLVFLGLGVFLQGAAKYVALLDLPAFGVAAALAFRYVDELQRSQRAGRKEDRTAARLKKIEDDYKAEVGVLQQAMRMMGVERVEEISEVLNRRPLYAQKVAELQAMLAELQQEPEYAAAEAQHRQVRERQEQLNSELLTRGGGYVRDVREIERELARTKESISLALQPAAAVVEDGGELEDPMPALLSTAAELQGSDVATLSGQVRDRTLQYFAALTDRRYSRLEFSSSGACLVHAASGQTLSADKLPPGDLDALFLSVRMTLVERVLAPAKLPFVVDEGFAGYEPRFGLLARMVKHLGTLTQVVLVTQNDAFAAADHTVAA